MANDREVLREVWDGKLPVCFNLSPDDVSDFQTPESYYMMVSRISYFPLVWDKVRKHFLKHVHSEKQELEMWLEYNGTALKWHYPIGLLFDMYAFDSQLPWSVTVHFDKFPENQILHCTNRETVEAHFMSSVKEADQLKHRSQIISTMQKKEHNQLWLGLQNDKFDQFWSVNKKLMETINSENEFKYIPFRCYKGDDVPFIQKLVKPITQDGSHKCLNDLIKEVNSSTNVRILIHGIEPPSETPLQWMSEHLSYPDNFLHLCLLNNDDN